MSRKAKTLGTEAAAIALSLLILIPVAVLVLNSFKDYAGANRPDLTFDSITLRQIYQNYSEVFQQSGLITAYKNSGIITFCSVTLTVLAGAFAGFIIQRRKSRTTELFNIAIIAGLSLPFSAPTTFFLVKNLGLSQTYAGISLVFIALSFPMAVFLFTGYFKSIPRSIDESAALDGSGPFRLFFQIMLPLIVPVSITVIIITFMGVWNDFAVSIFMLNTPKKFTVVLTTFSFYGQKHSDWNLLFADVILISLPVVILFLFLQKYVISGLTSGAVKG